MPIATIDHTNMTDGRMASYSPTTAHATSPGLSHGWTVKGGGTSSIIFIVQDMSFFHGKLIQSALLRYRTTSATESTWGKQIILSRLLVAGVTHNCTWNTYDGSNAWPGGPGGAADASPDNVLHTLNHSSPFLGGYTTKEITGMFQDAVAAASAKLAILLQGNVILEESQQDIASVDHATVPYRPFITVTYSLPGGEITQQRNRNTDLRRPYSLLERP